MWLVCRQIERICTCLNCPVLHTLCLVYFIHVLRRGKAKRATMIYSTTYAMSQSILLQGNVPLVALFRHPSEQSTSINPISCEVFLPVRWREKRAKIVIRIIPGLKSDNGKLDSSGRSSFMINLGMYDSLCWQHAQLPHTRSGYGFRYCATTVSVSNFLNATPTSFQYPISSDTFQLEPSRTRMRSFGLTRY